MRRSYVFLGAPRGSVGCSVRLGGTDWYEGVVPAAQYTRLTVMAPLPVLAALIKPSVGVVE